MDVKKNGNLLYATRNALAGFPVLLRENAARREILLILFALACAIHAPGLHSFVFFALSIVLLAIEALNTAIETICDHITAESHPDIKAIKDVAAAGVFLMVMLTGAAGILFLLDYFGSLGPLLHDQ
ncbi:MAG: diacylglycerol kinase [Burkholderiaceae bacterium]